MDEGLRKRKYWESSYRPIDGHDVSCAWDLDLVLPQYEFVHGKLALEKRGINFKEGVLNARVVRWDGEVMDAVWTSEHGQVE